MADRRRRREVRRGETAEALAGDFGRLQRRFAADPERDRFEDWTLTVVLTRR